MCMRAYTSVPHTPLYDAGIIMGTLDYARIHKGPFVTNNPSFCEVRVHNGPKITAL